MIVRNNIRSENKMSKCAYFVLLMYKIHVTRIVQSHTCQSPTVCVYFTVSLDTLQEKSRRQSTYSFLQKISLARLPSLRTDKKLRLPWQHDGTMYIRMYSTKTGPCYFCLQKNNRLVQSYETWQANMPVM